MSTTELVPPALADQADSAQPDGTGDRGTVVRVAGSIVGIRGLRQARLFDMVLVGDRQLPGEIIRLSAGEAVAQVYEPTTGLRAGDPATGTGGPLSIELGPGLLGAQLLGADTLPPQQQVVLRTARLLREDFLQQSSFDEADSYCPPAKQHAMLSLIKAAHDAMAAVVAAGAPVAAVTGATTLGEITQLRAVPPEDAAQHAADLARRITETLNAPEGDTP